MQTSETLLETDTPVASPHLQFCHDVTYGYIHRLESEFKPGLRFTESGLARAASICGWLSGIAAVGRIELANELADDLLRNLRFLATYGGTAEYRRSRADGSNDTVTVPRYTVELSDDGSAHGFGILWYAALVTDEAKDIALVNGKAIKCFDRWPDVPHTFSFNGGLIYHGPGCGETFTCNTGSRPWGIHT
jgi:hypothetical protein